MVTLGLHTTRLDIKQFYVLPLHSTFVCFTSQYKQGLYPYTALIDRFLGAFAKLRKAAIISVTSVCPSAWNNSAPMGWLCMNLDI